MHDPTKSKDTVSITKPVGVGSPSKQKTTPKSKTKTPQTNIVHQTRLDDPFGSMSLYIQDSQAANKAKKTARNKRIQTRNVEVSQFKKNLRSAGATLKTVQAWSSSIMEKQVGLMQPLMDDMKPYLSKPPQTPKERVTWSFDKLHTILSGMMLTDPKAIDRAKELKVKQTDLQRTLESLKRTPKGLYKQLRLEASDLLQQTSTSAQELEGTSFMKFMKTVDLRIQYPNGELKSLAELGIKF